MKKTILAIALPMIIYGCSDNNESISEKFGSFEKSYLAATSTLIKQSSALSTGNLDYQVDLKEDNGKVKLIDSFNYSETQNSLNIQYNLQASSDVNLAKYNSKNGQANIVGTASGDVVVEVTTTGDSVVLENIFANSSYEGFLDEKTKTFGYKSKLEKNIVPVLVSAVKVADLTLEGFNGDAAIHFNEDYSEVASIKTSFSGENIGVKVVGPLAEEVQFTADISKLITSSNYQVNPLKYDSLTTLGNVKANFASAAETGSLDLDRIETKVSVKDHNGLIAIDSGYNVGAIKVKKDQADEVGFGALTVLTDIKGLKNIKNWQELIQKANEIASQNDFSELTEEEASTFLKSIAEIFTKDSRIEFVAENKLTIGDALKLTVAFQPSESFITLIHAGPEAVVEAMGDSNPIAMIDQYVHEFKFVGTVTEGYLISQYEKFLTLSGQDTSSAKNDVKGAIQMVMMIAAMQSAPLGVSPIELTAEGTLLIDIEFKDGKWNINGKTLTTAEIFAAFQ